MRRLLEFLLDPFRKRREEAWERKKKEKSFAETKRGIALITEVCDWLREDPENRALLVCISAVTGTWSRLQDVERTERQWRFMMTEHKSYEQSAEEAEGGV